MTENHQSFNTRINAFNSLIHGIHEIKDIDKQLLRNQNKSRKAFRRRISKQIDEAWRVLKDPQKRAAYDKERVGQAAESPPAADNTPDKKGFLPPPPPTQGISLPMPSVEQHLERVHAIESGEAPEEVEAAPSISMPQASPERDAPPPPTIPMPGDDSDGDLIEEPEVSFADLSSEDGSAHFETIQAESITVEEDAEDAEDDLTEPPTSLENPLDFMSLGGELFGQFFSTLQFN